MKPEFSVLSFNVWTTLSANNGEFTELAKNRVRVVKEQILSYAPTVIGLQEDTPNWKRAMPSLDGYTEYRPAIEQSKYREHCSIYVKDGVEVVDNGYKLLTSDSTWNTVALTYAELTDGDGIYDMSAADLGTLGLDVNNQNLQSSCPEGTDKSGSAVNSQEMLEAKLMNYVILKIDGELIVCVNSHLQYRGYNNKSYTDHPLYMLRYYERCAQWEMLQEQIERLKAEYGTDNVVIMGDFNDRENSVFYDHVVDSGYFDCYVAAKVRNGVECTWNYYFDGSSQGSIPKQNVSTNKSSRLDFCFVSESLSKKVYRYEAGNYEYDGINPSDHLPVIVEFSLK